MIGDRVAIKIDRHLAMILLGSLMRAASESTYCAGWMMGLEDDLPEACQHLIEGTDNGYNLYIGTVSRIDAEIMVAIAKSLGHWVDYDNNPYIPECDQTGVSHD